MEYLIYGSGAIFVIYKVAVYFGRKNAIDVMCHNHQPSKEKVGKTGLLLNQWLVSRRQVRVNNHKLNREILSKSVRIFLA
jgi:hypothetical protein